MNAFSFSLSFVTRSLGPRISPKGKPSRRNLFEDVDESSVVDAGEATKIVVGAYFVYAGAANFHRLKEFAIIRGEADFDAARFGA